MICVFYVSFSLRDLDANLALESGPPYYVSLTNPVPLLVKWGRESQSLVDLCIFCCHIDHGYVKEDNRQILLTSIIAYSAQTCVCPFQVDHFWTKSIPFLLYIV